MNCLGDMFMHIESSHSNAARGHAGAAWSITSVANSSRGVTVRTQAVFSANANVQWLPSARRVYDMLRTGTCSKALYAGPWGLSSVQQVVFPYLISAVSLPIDAFNLSHTNIAIHLTSSSLAAVQGVGPNPYVPGSMIHGLNLNLLLQARTMNWLTLARANNMLKPLQNAQGTRRRLVGGRACVVVLSFQMLTTNSMLALCRHDCLQPLEACVCNAQEVSTRLRHHANGLSLCASSGLAQRADQGTENVAAWGR